VHGHLARLAKLGLVDGEHAACEVDVLVAQRQCLGDPQPRTGDQAEQCLEDAPAQARGWAKPSCGGQQVDDLVLAVDVRSLSLGQTTEDRVVGNLGAWLELLQPTHERAQVLEPPRPSMWITAALAVAPCPVGHDLHRQRSAVADGVNVAREAAQGVSRGA
jgi:hypothetical protein